MATDTPSKRTDSHNIGVAGDSLAAAASWRRSAPDSIQQAFRRGRNGDGWAAWLKHLACRKNPAPPAALLSTRSVPLLWALPDGVDKRGTPELIQRLHRVASLSLPAEAGLEEQLIDWLSSTTGNYPEAYALEALAWCHVLPPLAAKIPAALWWDLLLRLLASAAEAVDTPLMDAPLLHQLLAGELALSLAYLLPEIKPACELAPAAGHALSTGLVNLLDGEGLPHATYLPLMRPLLACWTRSLAIAQQVKPARWSADGVSQYRLAVRSALRLARYDGTQVFSDDSSGSGAWCPDLFDAALAFSDDARDVAVARAALPPSRRQPGSKPRRSRWPEAATHSEWSAVAVLRPDWRRSQPRLTVTYDSQPLHIELQCGRDLVWSGPWQWEIRCDGEAISPAGSWEATCWVSDEDADYLELTIDLSGGFRLERQMFLARQEGFLLLADAVLGRPGTSCSPSRQNGSTQRREWPTVKMEGQSRASCLCPAFPVPRFHLEYRSCLPLVRGIKVNAARQTWECFLTGRRRCARVLPLALSEWRSDPRRLGSLERTATGLELRLALEGRSLYAPLFLDLQPRRMSGPFTWRQLTVAESLAIQPDDVAVGYRVMLGQQQWLIYRSLAPSANRTLLGHNLSTEMLVARFDRSGDVQPLVEIE